jgi:ABC-type transport system substrate-binding protein
MGARDAFGQALAQRTDEVSAPDDKTIVFRLKQPFALLPDALCHGASNMCAMMPQHIAETDPFKQFTEVVGSGPFRFRVDERVQGSLFVYERFAGYNPREGGESSFTAGPKIVHFDRIECSVCGPTRLVISAACAASTTMRWSCRVLIGFMACCPGNSQPCDASRPVGARPSTTRAAR